MNTMLLSVLTDAFFIALLIWCGIADMKKRIVPNVAIVLLLCFGIVHVCLIATSSMWWTYPAGLIFAIPYFIVWLKDGIGAGDVKLIIAVGLYLGLLNMIIAFVLMIPILVFLTVRSWIKNKTVRCRIPFAPVMAIGAVGAMLLGYLFVLI